MSESKTSNILDFFPLPEARLTQKLVLQEIDKVFREGKRIVILEAPVGSGKSAMAIALARQEQANGSGIIYEPEKNENGDPIEDDPLPCHILTPRKGLQDQYHDDFSEHLVLMKGRNAYPCIREATPKVYIPILKAVAEGKVKQPVYGSPNCAEAPCRDDLEEYKECTELHACPYSLAIEIAQQSPVVVHNLHSFLYQTNFADKFQKRRLLIIDEAHEVEGIVRDFATRVITVNKPFTQEQLAHLVTVKQWLEFLRKPEFVPEETDYDRSRKAADPKYESPKEAYLSKVQLLEGKEKGYESGFSVECEPYFKVPGGPQTGTRLTFVPHDIGHETNRLILDHGHRVLLMSGTIYDKDRFCKNLGINPAGAHFIRVPSTFPVQNRPIYLKPEYQVDTSHAKWEENFEQMLEIIRKVGKIFHNVKGLIHAPSYAKAHQVAQALADPRFVTHEPGNFSTVLDIFFQSKDNHVLITPVCYQGTDFKDDRARFQLILTVPYASVGSKFVSDKLKKDFAWYNHQALVVFGQQLGRPVRGPNDYGATFCVDARFNKFIGRNSKQLPNYVKEAMVYK